MVVEFFRGNDQEENKLAGPRQKETCVCLVVSSLTQTRIVGWQETCLAVVHRSCAARRLLRLAALLDW